jgi:hypothetical protein
MAKQFKNPFPNVGKWQNSIESRFPVNWKWQIGLKVDFQSTGNGKTVSKGVTKFAREMLCELC